MPPGAAPAVPFLVVAVLVLCHESAGERECADRPRRTAEEDLCQMIFVRLFQKLDQFSGKVPLEHWVARIAINTCRNQIQAEKVRPELRHADLSSEEVAVVQNLAATPDELAP